MHTENFHPLKIDQITLSTSKRITFSCRNSQGIGNFQHEDWLKSLLMDRSIFLP